MLSIINQYNCNTTKKHGNMTTMIIMFDRYTLASVLYKTIHLQHDLSYWTPTIVL